MISRMASQGSLSTKYSPLDSEVKDYKWKRNGFTKYFIVIIIVAIIFVFVFGFNLYHIYDAASAANHDIIRANMYATEEYLHDNAVLVKPTQKHADIDKNFYHSRKKIVCYYNTPSNVDDLQPEQLPPDLCTHINIAFAEISNNTIVFNEQFNKTIKLMTDLKAKNADLKILISIGGAGQNDGFPAMVVTHATRKEFIKSIKKVLYSHDLDGVDLDWEFPAVNSKYSFLERLRLSRYDFFGGSNDRRQRQHFTQLLREIRAEFIREKCDYLLTVAVAAPQSIVMAAYDVSEMNKYVDYVNIMTYDFHFYTVYTPFTGINSPLYETGNEIFLLTTLNTNYTAHFWLNEGMERNKIVIGIPTYGHSFTLRNSDNHGIGSPASGYGRLGNNGFVNFSDICSFLSMNERVGKVFDNNTESPYFYKGSEWVSYENRDSVTAKAQYIKDNNFGGAMIYSLNTDDTKGICSSSHAKYPLTNTVGSVFFNTDL